MKPFDVHFKSPPKPVGIPGRGTTLGDLRAWLAANPHLPDSALLLVWGNRDDDGRGTIVAAGVEFNRS